VENTARVAKDRLLYSGYPSVKRKVEKQESFENEC